MAVSFLKKVQNTPKVKAVKKKIKANDVIGRRLSAEYKRLIKSESKRLSKSIKKTKKSKKKTTRRR